jgi:hypothetical protein
VLGHHVTQNAFESAVDQADVGQEMRQIIVHELQSR